jgi:hypothetical protein
MGGAEVGARSREKCEMRSCRDGAWFRVFRKRRPRGRGFGENGRRGLPLDKTIELRKTGIGLQIYGLVLVLIHFITETAAESVAGFELNRPLFAGRE